MKKVFMIIAAMCMTSVMAFAQKTIRVSTDKTDLVMQVSPKGRLYQVYLGDKLKNPADYQNLKWDVYAASDGAVCQRGHEVYATSGAEDFFEPAVAVTHADGNMTTYLYYQSSEEKAISGGVETIITLKDKVYPLTVKLHYAAYPKENVIKAWSEISHKEKAPVTLWRYSSTMLYFKANKYFVTNYHSDWAKEGQPETCQLTAGKKIVDSSNGMQSPITGYTKHGLNQVIGRDGGVGVSPNAILETVRNPLDVTDNRYLLMGLHQSEVPCREPSW